MMATAIEVERYFDEKSQKAQGALSSVESETAQVRAQGAGGAFGTVSRGLTHRFKGANEKMATAAIKAVKADVFKGVLEMAKMHDNPELWRHTDVVLQKINSCRDFGDSYPYSEALHAQNTQAKIEAVEHFVEKYASQREQSMIRNSLASGQSFSWRQQLKPKDTPERTAFVQSDPMVLSAERRIADVRERMSHHRWGETRRFEGRRAGNRLDQLDRAQTSLYRARERAANKYDKKQIAPRLTR
jgi:hypothetical protein